MDFRFLFFLLGLTSLIYEILLIKIFSIFISPFFASIFISISLFGIGIGNAIAYKIDKNNKISNNIILLYSISFFLIYCFFYSLNFYPDFIANLISQFQKYKNTADLSLMFKISRLFYILLVFLVITSPMILSGLAYIINIQDRKNDFENLYIYNLIGGGLGVILPFYALRFINPFTLILFCSFIMLLCYIWNEIYQNTFNESVYIYIVILFLIILFSYFNKTINFSIINGKNYGTPIYEKWNHISNVTVINKLQENKNIEQFVNKPIEPPRQTYSQFVLFNNNDQGSGILTFDGNLDKIKFLEKDITAFPYYIISADAKVLIIGSGGGIDILVSLIFGHNTTAVEINPLIVDVVNNVFSAYSGKIYSHPKVNTIIEDGRLYLQETKESFDLISMLYVHPDDFFSVTGFSLIENYLLTEEAFQIYYSRLSITGILQICGDFNKNEILRIIALYKNTMKKNDLKKSNFIILETRQKVKNILFKKNGFTDMEIATLINKANEFQVTCLYPNSNINSDFTKLISANSYIDFNNTYSYDITPSTDDKPFFFYFKVQDKN